MSYINSMAYSPSTLGGLYVHIIFPKKGIEVEIFNINDYKKEYSFNVKSSSHDFIKDWEMSTDLLKKYRPTVRSVIKKFDIFKLQSEIQFIDDLLLKWSLYDASFGQELSTLLNSKAPKEDIIKFIESYNANDLKREIYDDFRSNCKLSQHNADIVLRDTNDIVLESYFKDSKNIY